VAVNVSVTVKEPPANNNRLRLLHFFILYFHIKYLLARKRREVFSSSWYTHMFNQPYKYEGSNFNGGNYLFTTDTKQMHVSKFYCPSM